MRRFLVVVPITNNNSSQSNNYFFPTSMFIQSTNCGDKKLSFPSTTTEHIMHFTNNTWESSLKINFAQENLAAQES
jgi:fumarate hydratase class II